MDRYKASGSDSFDAYFNRRLKDTGMNMSQVVIYSAEEKSAAPVTGRPLSIMGLSTVALAAFIALSI